MNNLLTTIGVILFIIFLIFVFNPSLLGSNSAEVFNSLMEGLHGF